MIRLALRVLDSLYGSTLVKDFGPVNLKACRADFVRQGLSRGECKAGAEERDHRAAAETSRDNLAVPGKGVDCSHVANRLQRADRSTTRGAAGHGAARDL